MTLQINDSIQIDNIDKSVGARLRLRRTILGLSQKDLADTAGVSFQQIQKYENGSNSMSSIRLAQLAEYLGVNVDYFFKELELSPKEDSSIDINYTNKDLLEWMRDFQKLGDTDLRKKVSELTRTLAEEYGSKQPD